MARETKAQKIEREDAINTLREMLPPGSKVYTIVTHAAKSGMSRNIACYVHTPTDIVRISHLVCRALGYPLSRDGGAVRIGGCGMDMGFAIVYALGLTLHGQDDFRAGYSLRHEWL